jgi:hypothetical protein
VLFRLIGKLLALIGQVGHTFDLICRKRRRRPPTCIQLAVFLITACCRFTISPNRFEIVGRSRLQIVLGLLTSLGQLLGRLLKFCSAFSPDRSSLVAPVCVALLLIRRDGCLRSLAALWVDLLASAACNRSSSRPIARCPSHVLLLLIELSQLFGFAAFGALGLSDLLLKLPASCAGARSLLLGLL